VKGESGYSVENQDEGQYTTSLIKQESIITEARKSKQIHELFQRNSTGDTMNIGDQ
jgi:hypothetical protein